MPEMIDTMITGRYITNDTIRVEMSFFYQHIGFGFAAVLTNLVIIFTFCRNLGFLKKSSFIFTLALSDIIEGIAFVFAGFIRVIKSENGTLNLMVHPTYCFQSFIPFLLFGNQLAAAMFILIGMERFLAICCFKWYYFKWTNKLAWSLTAVAVLCCLISIFGSWLVSFLSSDLQQIPIQCGIGDAVDDSTSAYNYFIAIFGGTIASVAGVMAVIGFTIRNRQLGANDSNLHQHIKRQLHLTKVLLCTTILDVSLVVIPSIFLMLIVGLNVEVPGNISAIAMRMISCRSALNLFIYIFFNKEFREGFQRAFRFGAFNNNVISPTTPVVVRPA